MDVFLRTVLMLVLFAVSLLQCVVYPVKLDLYP